MKLLLLLLLLLYKQCKAEMIIFIFISPNQRSRQLNTKATMGRKDPNWQQQQQQQQQQVNAVFHSPVLERCTEFWNTVLECLKGIFQHSFTVLF